ncbi:hypothetical protein NC653_017866 [Populus alba x Populus x berolinensis]|uniref:3-hydroxyisobutyryl-CoA hydrolase n=1 Tax=Populus alba x Populus x berolinensis TaxID=444605 RepID=A0AAD6QRB9_9ROSI|nr:hypothetical protein NC653_017866 [Populus alba x Populus x berolinensis]
MRYMRFETFDKCFSHDTVEEIVDALVSFILCVMSFMLQLRVRHFAIYLLRKMRKLALMMNGVKEPSAKKKEAAPLCLKVTLQLIREGRFQSLDQCLAHEYCTSPTGISKRVSNDFCEITFSYLFPPCIYLPYMLQNIFKIQ